jgi:hypothetical protein
MGSSSSGPNVVLVHGGFVDGSGWHSVYEQLKQDGYNVRIVQNPTLSLEGDARRRDRSSANRTDRSCLSATRTVAQ